MGRGTGAEVWRSRVPHVSGRRVAGQLCRVRKHRVRMVGGGVVLLHAMVRLMVVVMVMGRWLVERRRRPWMLERDPMVVRIIGVGSLGLLSRMRLLWRVVDIVICSHTVVARQCASNTWVPPERAALAGRRDLGGNDGLEPSPPGLRCGKQRGTIRIAKSPARLAWAPPADSGELRDRVGERFVLQEHQNACVVEEPASISAVSGDGGIRSLRCRGTPARG